MVSIVSGNSLGVSLTSLNTLGQLAVGGKPTQGRNGEAVYVNAATGNLVLQDMDLSQAERGSQQIDSVRTYNSLGSLGPDNWSKGFDTQALQLTAGTVNNAGSIVTRVAADGSAQAYTYNATTGVYTSTGGGGAYDTITYNATTHVYSRTDGATQTVETYSSAGALTSTTTADGNVVSYTRNTAGYVTSVTDPAGATLTTYVYDSSNRLTSIQTKDLAANQSTWVYYTYDTSNRLSLVKVDLTPADNVVDDLVAYVTRYTYVGTTSQVSTVSQSDGTSLTFTYDTSLRVATITDQAGNLTKFAYDTAKRNTTVTDPNGSATVYNYDTLGQLSSITAPTTGTATATTSFAYDGNGNVTQVTDGLGRTVTMTYDASGNQTQQQDSIGNTVARSYDALNHLVTETAYVVADPDGAGAATATVPMTTRYVYDPAGQHLLRFVLTPEGRVTEYRYDAAGNRTATIGYGAGVYALGAMAVNAAPTLAQMTTWIGTQDLTHTTRTDVVYDAFGQASTSTVWGKVDATGAGVSDGSQSVSHYVYDQFGKLLSTISTLAGTTTYAYDGMGRVLTTANAAGTTTTTYDEAHNKTIVTYAGGLVVTSVHDNAGRLVSVTQGTATTPTLGTSQYAYDADGNLRMTTAANGVRAYMLYDAGGRKIADIDASGSLIESVYDNDGRVVETIAYANTLSAAQLASLVDANGNPTNVALSTLRPTGATYTNWTLYDAAGRVSRQVDAAGYVTETRYDGASRVTDVIRYKNATTTTITAATLPTDIVVSADATYDRHTRTLYDNDGLVTGTLDAAGYLTENVYDSLGQLLHTIAYATASPSANLAAGTLAQLRPAADALHDIHAWNYYDAQGRVVANVDGEGFLTEYGYDADGNRVRTLRYATRALVAPQSITASTTLAQLRPVTSALDHTTTAVYNTLDQLTSSTDEHGTLTQYTYDSQGRLLTTTSAATTSDARTVTQTYDVQGRLTGELGGRGSAALAALGASPAPAQVTAVWAAYGTTYTYDAAGLRTSMTDAAGNKTFYFYNADGQQTFVVNGAGEVTETRFNGRNLVSATIRYGTRIATTGLTGGADSQVTGLVTAIAKSTLDSTTSDLYDARGELNQQTGPTGRVDTKGYDAFGDVTTAMTVIGQGASVSSNTTFDRRGQVVGTASDTAGIAATTSEVRDAFGRITSATDANGNVTTTAYDRLGRAVQATDGMTVGRATTGATYDAFGRTLTTTDGTNHVTTYTWNDASLTMAIRAPSGATVVTTFDRHGETLNVRNGDGFATTTQYDLDGDVAHTIVDSDAGGLALDTRTDYDTADRVYDTIDASGLKTVYTYDKANRVLTRTVDYGGQALQTQYVYDAKGQVITQTDPDGIVTKITYDLAGNVLTRTVDPTSSNPAGLNLVTTFTYDNVGDVLTQTDPSGTVTAYAYDHLGRRTSMTVDSPNGGLNLQTRYAYDKAGNLTQKTDPAGGVTRYVYDADNRLHYTLDAENGLTETDYDANGRVTQQIVYAARQTTMTTTTAANGTVTNTMGAIVTSAADQTTLTSYDIDGRKVMVQVDPNGQNLTTQYAYDNAGNVTRVTDPAGNVTRTVYDTANRAVFVIDPAGVVTQTAYDKDGRVRTVTTYATAPTTINTTVASNGTVTTTVSGITTSGLDRIAQRTYDAAGRQLTATVIDGAASLTTQYAYDADGNVTRMTDANGNVTLYAYDNAGRQHFRLDPLGHLTETDYDGAGRVVTQIAYSDLQAGAITAAQAASGLVTTTVAAITPDIAFDQVTRYAYDAAGRQVYAVDALGNVTQSQFDADGRVVAQRHYATPIALPTIGSTDGKTITVSGSTARVTGSAYYPLNTAHTYTVTVRARQVSGTGTFYAGVVTKDASGNVLTNTSGTGGTYCYCAGSKVLTPDMGWTTFTGTITGTSPASTNPINYNAFFAGSTQVSPLVLYNYYGGNADPGRDVEIDSISIFDNTAGVAVTPDSDLASGMLTLTDGMGAVENVASSPRAALTAAQVAARLRPGPNDQVVRYAYDKDGRQVFAVDGNGSTTETDYDAAGNVVNKTVFATPIGLPTAGSADGKTITVNGNAAQLTAATYYALDTSHNYTVTVRARQVSGTGTFYAGVITKDANGNVLTNVNGNGGTYSYCAGYKVLTPDMGWTTFTGTITGSYVPSMTTPVNYNTFIAGSTQVSPLVLYNYAGGNGDPGRDVEIDSISIFDNTTGTAVTTDPELVNGAAGYVDGFGAVENVASTVDAALTADQIRARLRINLAADRTTRYAYDAAGRPVLTVDPTGQVTETTYDADGNVATTRAYANTIALPADHAAPLSASAIRAALSANATADRVTRNVYDADGRLVLTVDPSGAATQTSYDNFGNVTQTRQLGTPVPGGKALQLNYVSGTDSSAQDALGTFTAGDVVTVTVRMYAPLGSTGKMWLTNGSGDAVSTQLIAGTGGWVTLTLTHTMATTSAMFVHLYGDRDGPHATPGTYAQYADLRVSSVQRGAVIADNFTSIALGTAQGQWQFTGSPQLTVAAPLALADSDADLLALVGSLANAATDRVTRYVYDEAGRCVLTVDPVGQATQTSYDADGNVTQTRQLATPVPNGGALRVNYVAGTNSSAGIALGTFAIGDVVTATVRFRGPTSSTHSIGGRIYVGDGTNPGAYSPQTTTTGGWQTITTSFTITAANAGTIYALVYGNRDGTPQDGDYIAYDDLVVTSQQKGLVYSSSFNSLTPGQGIGQWRVDANEYLVNFNPADAGTDAQLATFVNANIDNARDRVTSYFYDAAGRQVYQVDGRGYVTETRYQPGHTLTIRYATPPSLGASPTLGSIASALAGIPSLTTNQYYDADGNKTDFIDASGVVSRNFYDGLGNLTSHVDAYGHAEQTTTAYTYDAAGRVLTTTVAQGTAAAATTVNTYDAFGALLTQVSAEGYALANSDSAWAQATRSALHYPTAAASLTAAQKTALMALYTTRYVYDLDGRSTTTTNALGATTTTTYDAFGDAVKVVDPLGNVGYFYFDALGRVTLQADPLGNLTQTTYATGFSDKVASVRRYAIAATPGTFSIGTPPTPTTNPQDAVTSYTYDADGRILSTTDGAGTESVKYRVVLGGAFDIFDKVVTNKVGGASTFLYDQDGNETSETLPVVSAGGVAVSNTYAYDGYGNRTQSIEGVNLATGVALPEARTTQYRYDAMGRVVARVGTAYIAADGSTVTPIDSTTYDALGRVIETRTNASATTTDGGKTYTATGGSRTLNYYDAAGNQVMRVAADGAITTQSFTATGKVFQSRAYSTPLSAGTLAGLVAGGPQPSVTPAIFTDRVTTYAYDALDRLVTTSLDAVVTWQQVPVQPLQGQLPTNDINLTGDGLAMQHTQTMQTLVYDADGNVVQQMDGRQNSTYNYYDAAGRKVLSIDPDGYVTAWDYNSVAINGATVYNTFDSPIQQVQYAAQMAAGTWARQGDTSVANANLRTPAALRAAVAALALPTQTANRVTQYVRDTAGRVTQQRVLGSAYTYVSDKVDANATDGTTTQGTADAVSDMQYDGLGNVTQSTQQVGAGNSVTTNFTYDALGRKTSEIDPAYKDYNGNSVRPETDTVYDALGNTASTTQLGSAGGPANRKTTYTYDANGNLATQTDAAGNVTTSTLDAMGRVARVSVQGIAVVQPVFNSDGSLAFNTDSTGSTKTQSGTPPAVVTTFTYDAMGRQVSQTDLGTGQIQFTKYDVFGDITDKGIGSSATGVVYQEHSTYNVLGKVESSTTGDGATKFYVYDANGNTTRQISSNSIDLSVAGMTIAKLIDPTAAGYIGTSVAQTYSVYDKRNNLIQTVEAKFTYQRDAASESAAYTETQVAPYSGMGLVTPGSSQTVAGGSNPQNVSLSSSSGTTMAAGSGISITDGTYQTASYTSSPATVAAVSYPLASVSVSGIGHRDCGLFYPPATIPNGTYRAINDAGSVLFTYSKIDATAGPTAMVYTPVYFQLQVGSQWVTVATITNVRQAYNMSGEPAFNNTTTVTNNVGLLLTGLTATNVQAYLNYGTPNQQALAISPAPAWGGGTAANAYVVAAPSSSGTVTVFNLSADGTRTNASSYAATVSSTNVSISAVKSPLDGADAWVSYGSPSAPTIVFNGDAAGGAGGTFYYRSVNTTGAWTAVTMAGNSANVAGLGNGDYDFRRSTGRDGSIELRGRFNVTSGNVSLSGSRVGVYQDVAPRVSLDLSTAKQITPKPGQYTLILKVLKDGNVVFTDTIPTISVDPAVNNGMPTSYALSSTELAALNSQPWNNPNYSYSYDLYANVSGARAQYVGNGSGTFTLGFNSAQTSVNAPTYFQPIASLSLPADMALGGTVKLTSKDGSTTYLSGTLGNDWRVTTGAYGNAVATTPLTVDLSQWLVTDGSQVQKQYTFSYSLPNRTFSCTLTMTAQGAVSATDVQEVINKPLMTLSLPGAAKILITYGSLPSTATINGSSGTWDVSGIASTNPTAYSYQALDASGNLIATIGSGSGSFHLDGAGNLLVDNKPSPTLVFNGIPTYPSFDLGTKTLVVTGVANTAVPLPDNNSWLFTPIGVADGTYVLTYTGKDSEGFVTTSGKVTLTMSNGIASYSNQQPDIQPLYLTGPKGYKVDGSQMTVSLPTVLVGAVPQHPYTATLSGQWSDRRNAMVFTWIPPGEAPSLTPLTMSMSFLDASGQLYVNQFGSKFVVNGTITLGASATTEPVLTQSLLHDTPSAEVNHHQSYNAFGQVASQWDDITIDNAKRVAKDFGETANTDNVVTHLYYDTRGDLIEKDDPETSVTDTHGVRTRVQPKTSYGYDLLGRLTMTVDANGNATRQSYTGGTQQASIQWNPAHWDSAAGAWAYEGKTQTSYDILGSVRQTAIDITDATHQQVIKQDTDILGNLVTVTQLGITRAAQFTNGQAIFNIVGNQIVDTYNYDAFGRRIAHKDNYGWYDFTSYDTLGRVKQTISDQGRKTNYTYQFVAPTSGFFQGANGASTGGWRLTTSNADGTSTVDDTNYFNQTTRHVDAGGDVSVYTFNFAAHLSLQSTTLSAQHTLDTKNAANPNGVTSTTLKYTYADNGDILSVLDTGAGTLSEYGYDDAGNRTFEAYGNVDSNGKMQTTTESATIQYDESGRMHRVIDNGVDVSYEYDAVGNRRRVLAQYNYLSGGLLHTDDLWYTYDDANRFTTSMGSLDAVGGNIGAGKNGAIITYDVRGDRVSAQDPLSSASHGAMQTYSYTVDGFLETTYVNGQVANTRINDALGRTLDNVTSTYGTGGARTDHHQTSNYDRDNRMQSQTDETGTTNYAYFNTTYVEGAGSQAATSASGNGQLASVSNGSTTTSYTYTLWDSADQLSIKVVNTNDSSNNSTTTETYNAEGFLVQAESGTPGKTNYAKTNYTLSSTGLVMSRQQVTGANQGITDNHYYYYAAGRTIGDVSDSTTKDAVGMSYAEQWATVTKKGVIDTSQYKTDKPVDAADFDQSYQPINASYPAATPTTYTAHNGDTLRSIARTVWGDADMWYLIAQANNLSASTSLVAGQILTIPNKVANVHNNANTFRPYDPSEAIGHIDPTLPPPPAPAANKGCGTIGMIIMVVVAVVVTIYTAGAAAELLGAAMTTAAGASGAAAVGGAALAGGGGLVAAAGGGFILGSATATAVAAAAIGGAVGSIASQAVGDLMGNTKGFSWKQVATSAVGSAITAGVGAAFAPAAQTVGNEAAKQSLTGSVSVATRAEQAGLAVAQAVTSSAVGQLVKGEWSWRQIAASAVSSAAGQAAGAAMSSAVGMMTSDELTRSFAQKLGSNLGGAWASQQVSATDPRYTKARTSSLFANALGQAIGDTIADTFVQSPDVPNKAQEDFQHAEHMAANDQEDAAAESARELSRFAQGVAMNQTPGGQAASVDPLLSTAMSRDPSTPRQPQVSPYWRPGSKLPMFAQYIDTPMDADGNPIDAFRPGQAASDATPVSQAVRNAILGSPSGNSVMFANSGAASSTVFDWDAALSNNAFDIPGLAAPGASGPIGIPFSDDATVNAFLNARLNGTAKAVDRPGSMIDSDFRASELVYRQDQQDDIDDLAEANRKEFLTPRNARSPQGPFRFHDTPMPHAPAAPLAGIPQITVDDDPLMQPHPEWALDDAALLHAMDAQNNSPAPTASASNVDLSNYPKLVLPAGGMFGRSNAVLANRWNAERFDLVYAADQAGIDAGTLAAIANLESGFDPTARPISARHPELNVIRQFDGQMAMSSAYGVGQIIDSTWTGLLNTNGPDYDVPGAGHLNVGQANAFRTDVGLQWAMFAELTAHNIAVGQSLGGPDDIANVYAMHNLGEPVGPRFLRGLASSPDASVSTVLSTSIISRNASLYGDGSISIRQAYQNMSNYMNTGAPFIQDARNIQHPSKH